MSNDFNRYVTNPVSLDISRSMFNDPVKVLMSGNCGMVYPIMCKEILPGDSIKCTTAKVVRVQPLVTPIFDNLWLDTYWFFVPNRLVWSHWKEFMGENTQTAWVPSVSYTVPQITIPSGGFDVGTLADHLGIPPKQAAGRTVSALPFRGYALIMNEFFRDQNLMNPVHVHVDDTTRTGVNTTDQVTDVELGGAVFNACKLHDLFTSALPGAQKANGPQVQFALNGLLPVNAYEGKSNITIGESRVNSVGTIGDIAGKNWDTSGNFTAASNGVLNVVSDRVYSNNTSGTAVNNFTPSNLFADLNNTSIFDINALRQAFAIQRFYEKQARGGSRMNEQIKSFFGVTVPDYRIQRPEYLGGNRIPIQISQVEQTSATQTGLTPQGNLTGISHTGDVHNDFVSSFYEHGYLFGLVVMRYEHTYQQGVEEHWTRKTLFDFYNPTFANLGEQILSEDLIYFTTGTPGVFGYQEAWATYRNTPNAVHGQMRSQATTPLDMWHLADNYSSMPYLSDSWIREDKSNLDRCLAVTSAVADQFMADFEIRLEEARPMPLYSVPGLIDHH